MAARNQGPATRLRAAVCGCGHRGRTVWQRHLHESDGFELVGIQDTSRESLDQAVAEGRIGADGAFLDLAEMLDAVNPDVLVACPIPAAHAEAVEVGLSHDCHVLVEKPFATEIEDAARLVGLAEAKSLTLGVVQNWRTKSAGEALKKALDDGLAGEVSHVSFRYVRDRERDHLPDYLFSEEDPILQQMGIHHLDLFRWVLGEEIVSVQGHETRPAWSRYRVPSINQLWMETGSGVVISYVATFSSRGTHVPQESLVIDGELGTLSNESAYFEPPLLFSSRDRDEPLDLTAEVTERDSDSQYEIGDLALLQNFRAAVTAGEPLIAAGHENLGTLAVVDAARASLRAEGPVAVKQPAVPSAEDLARLVR